LYSKIWLFPSFLRSLNAECASNKEDRIVMKKTIIVLALAEFTEAIRLDPDFAVPCYNRGLAYHDNGDYDKVITDYTGAQNLSR
jgi:tetratricopeptide (TPR) repeat protein